jgi:transcriptional regulator with XRE-family HTH domain
MSMNESNKPNGAPKGFGRIIAKARTGHKDRMGQKDLSKISGVSAETIKRIEMGQKKPSKAQCDALAVALGLDPVELWSARGRCEQASNRTSVKLHVSTEDAALIEKVHKISANDLARQLLASHLDQLRERR